MNNVGAIFRTTDGAGWDKIVLTGYTPTPPRKEIDKTALWAQKNVAWEYFESAQEAIKKYKINGYTILSAEKNDVSQDYRDVTESKNLKQKDIVLILWNEVDGVSDELCGLSDHILHLPMHGEKSSLNVAVAAGVFLYHFS